MTTEPERMKNKVIPRVCVGCCEQIHDQFILRVAPNLEWHAACLKCCECQRFLDENHTCFVREGKIFCKEDYLRLFGTKCDKCLRPFGKTDYVMRAKSKIFHLDCFRCVACDKQLVPGEEFALRQGELFCRDDHFQGEPGELKKEENNNNNNAEDDYDSRNGSEEVTGRGQEEELGEEEDEEEVVEKCDNELSFSRKSRTSSLGPGSCGPFEGRPPSSPSSSNAADDTGSQSGKQQQVRRNRAGRVRTVLSEKQLNLLKSCYAANPRPDALMKEQLVEMTGLSPRVVRVWFQNKRCKDKKKLAMRQGKEGRKLNYAGMPGVPMVASAPMRQPGSAPPRLPPGAIAADIHCYEPPWKALCDFAMHADLDKMGPAEPKYQQLVNQMRGCYDDFGPYPALPPPPPAPPTSGTPASFSDHEFLQQEQQLAFDEGQQRLNGSGMVKQPLDSAGYTLTSLDAASPMGSEA